MKKSLVLCAACLALLAIPGCKFSSTRKNLSPEQQDTIEKQLSSMTLREKVGQLFCVRPESLDPVFQSSQLGMMEYKMQAVNEETRAFCEKYPVGGITLFSHNIDNPQQIKAFTRDLHTLAGEPLLSIDEEGGRVARIGNNGNFHVPTYASMAAVGATGDPAKARDAGISIGTYLKEYGFDVDFAPVADVNTNPRNIIIGDRAFSDDPAVAAPMVAAYVRGMRDAGIASCLKHFPGHGDTLADTHLGYAFTRKSWEEIDACEMVTFRAGIAAGAPLVMAAHIAAPAVTGSDIPSTLSPGILTDKLRGELGFNGIIITDALEMGAITARYGSGEAAVRALEAGADWLLCPLDYCAAFDAVVEAVGTGRLSEGRLEESLRRIRKLRDSGSSPE